MPTLTALPSAIPDAALLSERSNELGVLLAAIAKLSIASDERESLSPAGLAALNRLAVRLHREFGAMLANANRASTFTTDTA